MGTPREIEPWQVVDSTWILRSGFMNIRRDRCRTADGSRLLEETGHGAPAFAPLGTFLLVPDLAAARGHVFLARDARLETAAPHLDEGEEIEVQAVPLDHAADYLEDVSSLLALHLARPRLR